MKNALKLAAILSALGAAACGGDEDKEDMVAKGPGAALKCTSSGKNAFDTYGAEAFVAVNEQIFSNVVAELGANGTSNVGTSFNEPAADPARLAMFKGNLAAFLVFAYGGPASITYTDGKTYKGPQDMEKEHEGMAITNDQYDYFVSNIIVPALTGKGVKGDDVSSCFAPVVTDASFKASIVGK